MVIFFISFSIKLSLCVNVVEERGGISRRIQFFQIYLSIGSSPVLFEVKDWFFIPFLSVLYFGLLHKMHNGCENKHHLILQV